MRTDLYEYEPDDGLAATEAGGATATSPDTAAAPSAHGAENGETAPPAVETETAAPPAFDPLEVQAEIDQLRTQNGELAQILQLLANSDTGGAEGAQFDVSTLDPFADDFGTQFAQLLQQRDQQLYSHIEQLVGQVAQPLQQQQEAAIVAEGEERLADMLTDDISRNGEFAADPEADRQARDLVRVLADQQFPEIAQRYGATPRAAELSMSRAAAQVRGLLKAAGVAAVTQHSNQVAALAGVNGEAGAVGAGMQVAPVAKIGGESLAAKYAAQARGIAAA